jgi:Flp pilus assembly protein TadB
MIKSLIEYMFFSGKRHAIHNIISIGGFLGCVIVIIASSYTGISLWYISLVLFAIILTNLFLILFYNKKRKREM